MAADERQTVIWWSDGAQRLVKSAGFISKRSMRQLRFRWPFWPRPTCRKNAVAEAADKLLDCRAIRFENFNEQDRPLLLANRLWLNAAGSYPI
jgi:hypothetical protein